jgi:glycosyltransferase involved in cell wall biosynthesis
MSGHILILFEGMPYPMDTRLRPQVAALLESGYDVTVIAPTGYGYDKREETVDGAHVRRFRPAPGGHGSFGYLREYAVALRRITRLARRTHREHPVDVVFISNPPDLLALSARPLVRRGARVVFDARELSPELFEAKFHRRGLLHRLLILAERYALRRADVVIAVSEPFIDVLCARPGVRRDRIFLVGNGPDPERIYPVEPQPALRRGREHLVLWLGVMSRQEGLERLVEAADEIVNRAGRRDVTFALVGPGDAHDDLRAKVRRRRLEGVVFISDGVGDDMVRAYLSTADVCVGVDECVGMNDLTVMQKILEYMAVGRSVVQFPLKEMRRICGDAAVYARNADSRDLGEKILGLLDDPERRRRLGEDARARAQDGLMWPQQVPALLAAVSTALALPRPHGQNKRAPALGAQLAGEVDAEGIIGPD